MDDNETRVGVDVGDMEAERRSKLGALLHNREARESHLNVMSYGAGPSGDEERERDMVGRRRKTGSLAAKAGTIMVRFCLRV